MSVIRSIVRASAVSEGMKPRRLKNLNRTGVYCISTEETPKEKQRKMYGHRKKLSLAMRKRLKRSGLTRF